MTRSHGAARAAGLTRCLRLQSRRARGLQGRGQQLVAKMGDPQWAHLVIRVEAVGPRPRVGQPWASAAAPQPCAPRGAPLQRRACPWALVRLTASCRRESAVASAWGRGGAA